MAREWIFSNSHFLVGIGRNRRCFICHGNLPFFNQILNLVSCYHGDPGLFRFKPISETAIKSGKLAKTWEFLLQALGKEKKPLVDTYK
jgi:hypothetical protein